MQRYITETLDQSKYLLGLRFQHGHLAFLEGWRRYADLLAETFQGQNEEIDRRLMALASGFMVLLFEGRTEAIIRGQLKLSDAFIHEPTLPQKFDRFIQVITAFIEQQVPNSADLSLSQRVTFYLQICELKELKDLTVSSLAQRFDYHPDHFTRKIKLETGKLASDLLVSEKLRRAVLLIKQNTGQKNLREISLSVGFQDYAHFRDLVKRHLGRLPSRL